MRNSLTFPGNILITFIEILREKYNLKIQKYLNGIIVTCEDDSQSLCDIIAEVIEQIPSTQTVNVWRTKTGGTEVSGIYNEFKSSDGNSTLLGTVFTILPIEIERKNDKLIQYTTIQSSTLNALNVEQFVKDMNKAFAKYNSIILTNAELYPYIIDIHLTNYEQLGVLEELAKYLHTHIGRDWIVADYLDDLWYRIDMEVFGFEGEFHVLFKFNIIDRD